MGLDWLLDVGLVSSGQAVEHTKSLAQDVGEAALTREAVTNGTFVTGLAEEARNSGQTMRRSPDGSRPLAEPTVACHKLERRCTGAQRSLLLEYILKSRPGRPLSCGWTYRVAERWVDCRSTIPTRRRAALAGVSEVELHRETQAAFSDNSPAAPRLCRARPSDPVLGTIVLIRTGGAVGTVPST